jgi:glucosamine--fructose-6-phosphate aminotransferase (isomerizing)
MNVSSRIFQMNLKQAIKNIHTLNKINIKNVLRFSGLIFFSYLMINNISGKKAKNCGIIGYLGSDPNAVQICVEGIQILQFRGYDSAGVCTINNENLQIEKCASDYFGNDQGDCIKKIVESVSKNFAPAKVGIGHTRWATHGRKISLNAHPHLDFSKTIALVHNGIVDNYKEQKDFLKSHNIDMVSETDSEVIVQLIGYYYKMKGLEFKEAVSKTLNSHIVGSYALAIINKDFPDKMIVARSGSPLLVGTGKDFFIVSSDVAAFQKWTNNYFNIDNGEILELDLSMNLSHIKIKTSLPQEVLLKPKDGYEHFMLQEIMEQPDTINRAMNYGSRFKAISNQLFGVKLGGLEQYVDFLKNIKNLVIVACGTSYFASMFVLNLIRKLQIFNTVQIVDGAEFSVDYIPKENPAIIFVSQSGETFDVLRPLEIARNKGVICIGIVNKVESTLAKSVLCGVFVNAGREISVASTKAFSGQCVALILTTLFFSQIKHESKNFFK